MKTGFPKGIGDVLLGMWIGFAAWQPALADPDTTWWATRPLTRPNLPATDYTAWIQNPVDQFIAHQWEQKGLSPSPQANPRVLLRRLYLDVWGLPPDRSALDALETPDGAQDWSAWVDRLLNGPHYGERWARHWMDIIHFAETHGHDEDAPREHAWPYRDWLIQSFNQDKPYHQFAVEQLAGDMLQPATAETMLGIGFLSAGPWDESSQMGIQDGTLDKQIAQYLDRDDMITTTMSSFLSLSVHCARCHDHKFDPITHADYYALQAVFAGVDRHDRPFDRDPMVHQRRQALLDKKTSLLSGRYPEADLLNEAADRRVQAWVDRRHETLNRWHASAPIDPKTPEHAAEILKEDHSIFFPKPAAEQGSLSWTFQTPYAQPTAIQLEVLPDDRLPAGGPGWEPDGNFRLSEFKVSFQKAGDEAWVPVTLEAPQNDFSEHTTSVRYLIDGKDETTWGILPQSGKAHRCYFEIKSDADIGKDDLIRIELVHRLGAGRWVGRCRVTMTDIARDQTKPFLAADLQAAFEKASEQRTTAERLVLSRQATMEHWDGLLDNLPSPDHLYAAASYFPAAGNFKPALGPREIRRLMRGNIRSPKEVMEPAGLSHLSRLPWNEAGRDLDQEGFRRLALAEWISHPDNGLFWRSMANRIWQYHFGTPLVDTPNDFGQGGSEPSHPALLDWLACELRDSGGSMKHLHRLLLTSATYRQASTFRSAPATVDAGNRYYWRMRPRRLDAESFRDSLLVLSGSMNSRMGGPSVKQFHMSPGVHVTPVVDYRNFAPDAPERARRSIYRFLFRTLPDPFMQSMDCPDASNWTPKRPVSVGPLQALALMHDDFVIHQCQLIVARLTLEHPKLADQVDALFRQALLRHPATEERDAVVAYAKAHGLANACRFVINSNAFMFVP